MTSIHQMLVSKELGGAGLIGIHLASFLRAKGEECCLWIPGEGAALCKIKQLALKFNVYDASCWTCSHDTGHIWEEIFPHPSEPMLLILKDLRQQQSDLFLRKNPSLWLDFASVGEFCEVRRNFFPHVYTVM
jgi:hypothetical protein